MAIGLHPNPKKMPNDKVRELIGDCDTLRSRIDNLQNEIDDAEEDLEQSRRELREILNESEKPFLIVEFRGLKHKVEPLGQHLVIVTSTC